MTAWQRWRRRALLLATLSLAAAPVASVFAQAIPTATQLFNLSVFGAGSGVYTDVFGGRNLSLTAGADLTLHSIYGLSPSLELRGTYPLHSGTIAGEKSVLLGLKVGKSYGRFHPYGDFLIGRGQIDYQRGGFVSGPIVYNYSSSAIYSPGLGVDLDLNRHWALKADYQYQMWTSYPLELKILKPSVITGGVVYRFDFNHHYRAPKHPERTAEPRQVAPAPSAMQAEPAAPPAVAQPAETTPPPAAPATEQNPPTPPSQ